MDITLAQFIASLTYTQPEKHLQISLVRKGVDGEEEFEDVPCSPFYVAKYAYNRIDNIAVENYDVLSVMVHEDED